jgi:hypothetical protein
MTHQGIFFSCECHSKELHSKNDEVWKKNLFLSHFIVKCLSGTPKCEKNFFEKICLKWILIGNLRSKISKKKVLKKKKYREELEKIERKCQHYKSLKFDFRIKIFPLNSSWFKYWGLVIGQVGQVYHISHYNYNF